MVLLFFTGTFQTAHVLIFSTQQYFSVEFRNSAAARWLL